jgi:hypothetical protein
MDSKNINTKNLEKAKAMAAASIGGTRSKPVQRDKLINEKKENFYANLKNVYEQNKDAKELPVNEKKKP